MKFYIILCESAFEKLPKVKERTEEITLLIDNAISTPDCLKQLYNTAPMLSPPEHSDKKACSIFTREFQKNLFLQNFSSDIEPNINGVYEYVITSINNILFTISKLIGEGDEIHLLGGNSKVKVAACYAIKSPEFNRNVFIDRADVLNPFLYQALMARCIDVKFKEDSIIYTALKYTIRVFLLFCYSYIFTFKKYVVNCFKVKDKRDVSFDNLSGKFILFPVRSNPQLDFVDSIAKQLITTSSDAKPLILYYEMLMGGAFYERFKSAPYSCISLFKFRYIVNLFLLPFLISVNALRLYRSLRKRPSLKLEFEGFKYDVPLNYLVFENLASPHLFFYQKLLTKTVNLLKSKKSVNIIGICSTEMVGTQAFIERYVSDRHRLTMVNIQTSAVFDSYYPVKVVGDKTLCLTSRFADNFNRVGISNKGVAKFIGHLKFMSLNSKCESLITEPREILYASQPYEPEVTTEFLIQLSKWLSANMPATKLRLRLHPRDNISYYSDIDNINFVPAGETIAESIRKTSLLLTRTSSVVLDAVGNKTPYLVCKLSHFDFNVQLPFLEQPEFAISSLNELSNKLQAFQLLNDSYQQFIKRIDKQENKVVFSTEESITQFIAAFDNFSQVDKTN